MIISSFTKTLFKDSRFKDLPADRRKAGSKIEDSKIQNSRTCLLTAGRQVQRLKNVV